MSVTDWTWTHNHFVHKHKQTLNCLSKLARWLSCVVTAYLYGAFDVSSSHVKYAFQRLSKWLSARLWTKWLWVRVQLQSLKLQISRLFRSRSSLHSGNYWSVDSLWNVYVAWLRRSLFLVKIQTIFVKWQWWSVVLVTLKTVPRKNNDQVCGRFCDRICF